jgi:opacity protein-like surface antigen
MKIIRTYISVGVLSASSVLCPIIANAQTATASETSQGSLGKRYANLGFGIADPAHTSDNVYGTAVGVNVPVTSFLDISGGYSYSRFKTDEPQYYTYKSDSHILNSEFVFYRKFAGGLKPFLSAGVGYSWLSSKIEGHSDFPGNYKFKDDLATWGTSVGIEIPFRWVALTPAIGYSGNFESSSNQTWSYGLRVSSWITRKVGVYAGVAYSEPRHDFGDNHTWSYSTGLRIKF